jgi:hypothetical protein
LFLKKDRRSPNIVRNLLEVKQAKSRWGETEAKFEEHLIPLVCSCFDVDSFFEESLMVTREYVLDLLNKALANRALLW